jgi:hypothetical protein
VDTPVWDDARSRGLVSENMDWDRLKVNFKVNHADAILLSETMGREKLYRIYRRLRRQRLLRNSRSLATRPMLLDLPKVTVESAREKILRFVREWHKRN